MSRPPVLPGPDTHKAFHVYVDTLKYVLGAALIQKDEKKKMVPVQYACRNLSRGEQTFCTFEREAAAVIFH